MVRTAWALSLAVSLAALAATSRAEEKARLPDVLALQQAMQDAIKRAEPAVACVVVARGDEGKNSPLHDPDHAPDSYGSAVVLDEKGLLLTNYHVVREATRIHVRLPDDKASYAEIHAADPRSDFAVLRLTDPKVLPVKAIKVGDGGKLRKGQFILSIANPYAAGFRDGSPSASFGVVSNLRRTTGKTVSDAEKGQRLWHYGTLIQTDAKLNLGCSGGALVNLDGELVGLTTALAAVAGGEAPGGFGVPMEAGMRRIIDVLLRGEEVEYGFLGVTWRSGMVPGPRGNGVQLQSVIAESPAWKANLRGHEVITAINDVPISDADDLFLQIGTLLAGTTCKIKAAAAPGLPPQDYTVRLAKADVDGKIIATKRPPAIGGLRVDYTSILVSRRNAPPFAKRGVPSGVMIREVVEGSPADTARLQPEKVILKVNGNPVNSPAEYYRAMQKATGAVNLTLATSDGREDVVRLETR
jgi:serine protease Do